MEAKKSGKESMNERSPIRQWPDGKKEKVRKTENEIKPDHGSKTRVNYHQGPHSLLQRTKNPPPTEAVVKKQTQDRGIAMATSG